MINFIVLIPFIALLGFAIYYLVKNKGNGCAGCTACKKGKKNCPMSDIDFSQYETKNKEK